MVILVLLTCNTPEIFPQQSLILAFGFRNLSATRKADQLQSPVPPAEAQLNLFKILFSMSNYRTECVPSHLILFLL